MIKTILSSLLVVLVCSLANAQSVSSSADKRIALLTRVMATELQLNEAEYIKLKALNRERVLKSDEVATMYSNDPAILTAKLNEVESEFDKQFTSLLNPVQLAAYKTYQQEQNSKLTAMQVEKPESKIGTSNSTTVTDNGQVKK